MIGYIPAWDNPLFLTPPVLLVTLAIGVWAAIADRNNR